MRVVNKVIKTKKIDWRKLTWLQPKNFKTIKPEIIQKLKTSLIKNGFAAPFHVWETKTKTYILDGSHRELAMKEMEEDGVSIEKMLPANFIRCANIKEAKKLVLIYNSHYAKIKKSSFFEFIADLDITELSLEIDIPDFEFNTQGDIIEDEVPSVFKKTKSKLGDIYELGKHKIICGDSTHKPTMDSLLNGMKIDMVFTDPPYGVDYSEKNKFLNNRDKGNRIQTPIKNDVPENAFNLWGSFFEALDGYLNVYHSLYICSPQTRDLMMMMMKMIENGGIHISGVIIWVKNNHVLGRMDYNLKHEPIIYGWSKKKKHKFYGKGDQKFSVWNFNKPLKNDLHPTMKPVELIVNAILNSSLKDMLIYDGFLGSGSTLIAAEQTGRICYGIELEPAYVDVIVQRWVNLTGKTSIKKNGKKMIWKKT